MLDRGEVSSVELTKAALDRIAQVEDSVKAFVTVTEDLATGTGRRGGPSHSCRRRRAAHRHPDAAQGQHDHDGRRHDLLVADARGICPAVRLDGDPAAVQAVCRADGQGQPGRVRDGVVDRELGVLPDAQPVGPRPRSRGQQRRPGGSGRGRGVLLLPRLRHRRQHPTARLALRRGRTQADLRRGFPLRTGRIRKLARPDRPDHQRRDRRRSRNERDRGSRSDGLNVARHRDSRLHGLAWQGSHRPEDRRPERVLRRRHGAFGRGIDASLHRAAGRTRAQRSPRPRCRTRRTRSPSTTSSRRRSARRTSPGTTA